ncbi:hypothetical protein [Halorussus caseinilyticus]|nr:hypothetical protein [Halorussus sp. DT72]
MTGFDLGESATDDETEPDETDAIADADGTSEQDDSRQDEKKRTTRRKKKRRTPA